MDIYEKRSYWKLILAIAGAIIVCITVMYSYYLSINQAKNEEKNIRLYAIAYKKVYTDANLDGDFQLEQEIIFNNTIPTILEDEYGFLLGSNFGESRNNDQDYLLSVKKRLLKNGFEPIKGDGYATKIYYTRTNLYRMIQYYPLLQILMVFSFVTFGYLAFGRSKKAEQNRVWAGMAKETAHQLGTPISAIIAWLENLKETIDGNEEQLEIVEELGYDVDRLELIADRFSKIGSNPELEKKNISMILDESKNYMQKRAPRRMEFDFPPIDEEHFEVKINEHLFQWVLENLIRNALDAMGNKGKISATLTEDSNYIVLDISDTGKGVPANKFKTVFRPGYSTKSRGWGLGLSLAKRIVEDYHKGKIYIKKSKLDEGTTFTIKLPKV